MKRTQIGGREWTEIEACVIVPHKYEENKVQFGNIFVGT